MEGLKFSVVLFFLTSGHVFRAWPSLEWKRTRDSHSLTVSVFPTLPILAHLAMWPTRVSFHKAHTNWSRFKGRKFLPPSKIRAYASSVTSMRIGQIEGWNSRAFSFSLLYRPRALTEEAHSCFVAFSVKRTLKAQVLAPLSRPHLHFTRDYLSNKRKRGIHILVRSLFLSLRVLVNSFTQVTPPCALFTCTKIPLWILRGMKIVTYIMDPRQSQNLHLLRISKILRPKSDCGTLLNAHRFKETRLHDKGDNVQ